MERLKALLSSIALTALGLFALFQTDAPTVLAWSAVIFFGLATLVLLGVYVYEAFGGKKTVQGGMPKFKVLDGRKMEVHYSDATVRLVKQKNAALVSEMRWKDIDQIYVTAAHTKKGQMVEWSLHESTKSFMTIPWNAKGADQLPEQIANQHKEYKQVDSYDIKPYFLGFKIIWERD